MQTFEDLNISKQLLSTLKELGLNTPTPVQSDSFAVIKSGKNVVGISQTGTGKTIAYVLPLLQGLAFSEQAHPRILILVPTRELVVQVVEQVQQLTGNTSVRVIGVYGGVNINTQALAVIDGVDVLVATPGRLYDLALNGALKLKEIKSLVIDEVDIMLDLGFRFQLTNIFELLPEKRQNIMFSATMTEEIDDLIDDYFIKPERISIAVSGTPVDNITQLCYAVPNFYTKVNLLLELIRDQEVFHKVLVFVESKKMADRLFDTMKMKNTASMGVIHSNKAQNARLAAVSQFDEGDFRMLISTDVMSRGLDLKEISHVINFDTPSYPENYMHRIGRTGRADKKGTSILFFTEREEEAKIAIELLMNMEIPQLDIPGEVEYVAQLIPEERRSEKSKSYNRNAKNNERGAAFHEKKEKNKKVNLGGSYHREIERKYSKPKTRGDKKLNRKKK